MDNIRAGPAGRHPKDTHIMRHKKINHRLGKPLKIVQPALKELFSVIGSGRQHPSATGPVAPFSG